MEHPGRISMDQELLEDIAKVFARKYLRLDSPEERLKVDAEVFMYSRFAGSSRHYMLQLYEQFTNSDFDLVVN